MSLPIEDYALIGDCHPAALVGRDGSIDRLCVPRLDSGACFTALLGEPRHGRWLIAPAGEMRSTRRRYRDGTLILESEFETDEGAVRIIDCMPMSDEHGDVVRIVEGLSGCVAIRMELIIRLDHGAIVPWVRRSDDTLLATAGPDTLELRTGVAVRGEKLPGYGGTVPVRVGNAASKQIQLDIYGEVMDTLHPGRLINSARLLTMPAQAVKRASEKGERPAAVTQTA